MRTLLLLTLATGFGCASVGPIREDPAQCGRRIAELRTGVAAMTVGTGMLCERRRDDPAADILCEAAPLLEQAYATLMQIDDSHCDALRQALEAWSLSQRGVAATQRLIKTLEGIRESP